jgi:predicted phage-related endonuclease
VIERLLIPAGMRLHPERPKFLTASDVPAAAGISPWKTPLALHLEKATGRSATAITPLMDRGIMFEPVIAAYVQRELPDWTMVEPRVFVVDRELRIGAHPDRLLEDPDTGQLVNCQLKLVGKSAFERWPDDQPPMDYQVQVACENMLLDAGYGVLAALVVSEYDAALHLFTVPRNAKAEERVREIAKGFWWRVDSNVPPPADYRVEAGLIRELYPPDIEVPVPLDLSGDNLLPEKLEKREQLRGFCKSAMDELDAIDAEIVDKLRGATLATLPGWQITRKMVPKKGYTVAPSESPRMLVRRIAA